MEKTKEEKAKIYERNPSTGVIRWKYTDESPDKFGWPNYGRILKQTKKVSSGVK
tara:strand:+ start:360 stop:521 length:162 start_codon:yes stop_codon:yes gene_type:complete